MSDAETMERNLRSARLISYLQQDPHNEALRAEAVSAAIGDHLYETAEELLNGTSSPPLLNLKGVLALRQGRYEDAVGIFGRLREIGDDPALRFNLAWANAMLGDFASANALLDEEAIAVTPHAAVLKIESLHHLDLHDEGLETGALLAERYPDNVVLMGALATLAMDADNLALAGKYAAQSGDNPEGLAARGMLMLDSEDAGDALQLFEHALAQRPSNPRATIGKGLALLASGRNGDAAQSLERGAELFEDHLGSWIAAGWAHFIAGDRAKARDCFDRAKSIDDSFAESHGALAVLDMLDGNIEHAQQGAKVALRLDRASLGGALAQSMLLEQSGKINAAEKVRQLALSAPIGPEGKTIADALARFARGRR